MPPRMRFHMQPAKVHRDKNSRVYARVCKRMRMISLRAWGSNQNVQGMILKKSSEVCIGFKDIIADRVIVILFYFIIFN